MVPLQVPGVVELLVLATIFFVVVGVPIVVLYYLHQRGRRVAEVEAQLEDDFDRDDRH